MMALFSISVDTMTLLDASVDNICCNCRDDDMIGRRRRHDYINVDTMTLDAGVELWHNLP
jgi:hypothetical protein